MKILCCLLTLLTGLGLPASLAAAASEAMARKLINSQGCKACHPLEGNGGASAPELLDPEHPLTAAEVRNQLSNPQHRHGDGSIPDFSHLRPEELEALIAFLAQPPRSGQASE